MKSINLFLLKEGFTIHRLPADSGIPEVVFGCDFFSITRTADEVSIVIPEKVTIPYEKREAGWACIKVAGPLDFSLTGILAGISKVLSGAQISIFALSTFDTDYIIVKKRLIDRAITALEAAGYRFLHGDE